MQKRINKKSKSGKWKIILVTMIFLIIAGGIGIYAFNYLQNDNNIQKPFAIEEIENDRNNNSAIYKADYNLACELYDKFNTACSKMKETLNKSEFKVTIGEFLSDEYSDKQREEVINMVMSEMMDFQHFFLTNKMLKEYTDLGIKVKGIESNEFMKQCNLTDILQRITFNNVKKLDKIHNKSQTLKQFFTEYELSKLQSIRNDFKIVLQNMYKEI